MLNRTRVITFAMLSVALSASVAHAQTPVASYTFANSLVAAQTGVPALTAVDPTNQSAYFTDTVFGKQRRVYATGGATNSTADQGGFSVATTGLIPANNYSVEMVLSVSQRNNAWRRLIDVQNRVSDTGFYVSPANQLNIFPVGGGGNVELNTYYHVVLSVAPNNINAYLNGQLAFNLTSDLMNINNANNPGRNLLFYLDDNAVSGEYSNARTALVQLYDRALNATEVNTLATNPFANTPTVVPEAETGILYALGIALPIALGICRRRK